ncbi:hypothetical protein HU200_032345 [Digitaria exilis]|uniref:Sister chromatid cohesion 1 protein 2 n=1 Tax=Digitaria exilis TaxID=1010633 RepID=A0A835BXH5_9POAL|nr:hypothetical protein HU200_032345 [Digitaria exilis]
MSYSKALLSKKGALHTVWVAAFCVEAALSRDQVARTDIVASVDKILSDVQGPQTIPHRILAQLVFGIVRIFSKKVYYLYHDCEEIRSLPLRQCVEPSAPSGGLTRGVLEQENRAVRRGRSAAGHLNTSKVKKPVHAMRTEVSSPISSGGFSISVETEVIVRTSVIIREAHVTNDLSTFTIPDRFELDSFDLGISEDTDDEVNQEHHQSARQDILLEDERHHAPYMYESYKRASWSYDVDSTCLLPEYIAVPREVMCAMSEANDILNADSAWFTPVKDVLPPDTMDMVSEAKDASAKSKTGDSSISKLNMDQNGGAACPMTPLHPQGRSQEVQIFMPYPTMEASESDLLLGKSNTAPPAAELPEHDTGLHESLEAPVLSCETRAENELSPSTPEPLPMGVPGPSSSSRFRVRTPAKTEKSQAARKMRALYNKYDCIWTEREGKSQATRKRRALYNEYDSIWAEREGRRRVRRRLTWSLYDESIILPNAVLREAVNDASDLVQKRRKAPHTHLDIWKVAKIGSLPCTFMDPLITYKSTTPLARVTAPSAPESSWEESVKARRCLSYEHTESVHSCKDTETAERESILDARRKKTLDVGTDFGAPIDCHTESGSVQDVVCEYNEDTDKENGSQVKGDEPSSEIPPKKGLHESENQIPLHNEAVNAALDIDEDISIDEEHTRDEGLLNSTRTRKIATCLHQLFLDQKTNEGTNSLSLNQVLEGTKKRTAATFFHETLVLQSRGLIEVNQEQPYADIILSSTLQLEVEVQRCRN